MTIHIHIDGLIHGGAGIGTFEGKKIFVPYAAPGDELEIAIISDHGSYAWAKIIRVVASSPSRVSPPCPVFGTCGGCQWQHLSYETQLHWKREILIDALMRIGGMSRTALEHCVLPTLPSPQQWSYRNRIQLQVDRGRVGFYKTRTHEVVEFEKCSIADEELNRILAQRREEFAKRKHSFELRLDGDQSFAQVNTLQNEMLKKQLLAWVQKVPHARVLELYAGSGNFTFAYAPLAQKVIATDRDRRAIASAKRRQQSEVGSEVVEFVCQKARDAAKGYGAGVDLVLLDPPRSGADDAVKSLAEGPSALLYISCNPSTLARDIKTLLAAGWSLERVLPIDMFPQTAHIESLSALVRSPTTPSPPL